MSIEIVRADLILAYADLRLIGRETTLALLTRDPTARVVSILER